MNVNSSNKEKYSILLKEKNSTLNVYKINHENKQVNLNINLVLRSD